MFVVGVRNNKHHNFKIIFNSRFYWLAKIKSIFVKPLFNEVEIQDTKNIVLQDTL